MISFGGKEMQILISIIALITLASAGATVILRRKGRSFDGMLFKFLSSFGFMSVAVLGFCINPDCDADYFCLVLFGLMFGLAGDILLGLKEIAPKFRMRLIGMGTGAFLIGHIFFLVAFLRIWEFKLVSVALIAVVAVASAILLKALNMKVDLRMGIILTVYYVLLWYKAIVSAWLLFQTGDAAFLVTTIGCVLFIFSDTCLALVYFTPTKSKNKLVTMELSSYYPAQILLALSVAFMGEIQLFA